MEKSKDREVIKLVEIIEWIIWKLLPNTVTKGEKTVDLHRDNIYFTGETYNKFNMTEQTLRIKINDKFPQLKDMLVILDEIREEKLLQQSLNKNFDGTFAKFVLTNKYKNLYEEKAKVVNSFEGFKVSDLIEIEGEDEG